MKFPSFKFNPRSFFYKKNFPADKDNFKNENQKF